MAKSDHEFINTGQNYELNDWLGRNNYRQTAANGEELQKIILGLKEGNSSKNLTWKELDDAHTKYPDRFKKLEKK